MTSDYFDRLMEQKFLGSGLSTRAAKKRFTTARRALKDAPQSGRALARVKGTDARLARANKYLTTRARRGKPPHGSKMSWEQLDDMNLTQMRQFFAKRYGSVRGHSYKSRPIAKMKRDELKSVLKIYRFNEKASLGI